MNILILRVSAIGDVIHTLPSIFLLKKIYPDAKISWIVQEKAASLLVNQPFLNKVWVLKDKFISPKKWSHTFKIIKEIKKIHWDVILDFQGILKTSSLLPFLKGEKYGFARKHARLKFTTLFTKHHITPIYTNVIEKNLALADNDTLRFYAKKQNQFNSFYKNSSPTIENLKESFTLNIPPESKNRVNEWLQSNEISEFIIIAPNTTWPSKHWPEKYWKQLLRKLSSAVIGKNKIVLLGKFFGQPGRNLAKFCKQENLPICSPPKFDLIETAHLISKANLLIAPDTGLLHLADFLNTKTIAIFGPTSVKKHGPFLNYDNIKNAIQVPCTHYYQKSHGNDDDPKENCMYQLKPEDLFEKIKNVYTAIHTE